MEDTKTAAQAEKGYTDKTQGYAAEASTSHPILYHLGKRRGQSIHGWVNIPTQLKTVQKLEDTREVKNTS
jgi:hypothetical protein